LTSHSLLSRAAKITAAFTSAKTFNYIYITLIEFAKGEQEPTGLNMLEMFLSYGDWLEMYQQ